MAIDGLILDLVHSNMGMSTMMCPYESYYFDSKHTCISLGSTMVLKNLNFKGLYFDF